jgi:tripartite-type tricarboxylate transporter receptor subunit TctC
MSFKSIATRLIVIGMAGLGAAVASAQEYPVKPVRIVTSGAGGGNDLMTRTIAQGITATLGQQIIVDNRPSGIIGETVAKSPADGYTLLLGGGSLWIQPFLQEVRYDVVKDFAPITLVERSPSLLVVHPSLPVKSIRELVALAKSRPAALNYAYASADTQLAAELFKAMAGADIVGVPYKTMGAALTDVLGGHITVIMSSSVVVPHIKAGRLRALAVTTPKESTLFPGLPAVAETVPGYEASAMAAMFAPANTPRPIINRLNQEIGRFLTSADGRQKFLNNGSEAVTSTPEELAAIIKTEMTRLGKVIKDAGIKTN